MGPLMQALAQHVGTSNFLVNLVAPDTKDADARKRARGSEGASIAWALGHLINYRYHMMGMLGAKAESPLKDVIGDSATDGADYPTMAELLGHWNEAAGKLEAAMAGIEDDYLLAKPGGDGPHGEQTRLATMSFFTWHEAYHIGQIGTMRKGMGYSATAELAMAARRK